MISPHVILGVRWDADDGEVRQRYLELVRSHPPSRDPDRFRLIREAYEQMGSRAARVQTHLFVAAEYSSFEDAVAELERLASDSWKPPGLREICDAEGR